MTEYDKGVLARNVREARLERMLTGPQLAKRAGVSRSMITYLESGRIASPHVHTFYAVALALGVPMEDLLGLPRIASTTRSRVRDRDRAAAARAVT